MNAADVTGLVLAGIARLITGAQGHWKGVAPKAEQRVYFANHQSHLDWMLIWATLPTDLRRRTRPIAAKDYWTATRFKHWLTREVFHAVYVERERREGKVDLLAPLAQALEAGDSLVLFPEGTRSNQGLPQPFKSGLFHLARKFPDVKLVPAWVDNVQRVMPKGEVVPVPVLCTVTFGAPCNLLPGETKVAFLERAHEAVVRLKPGGVVSP
ncbi:MAG TPA: lysophospholipid acyltransferase family protein [Burkholderiaceae bacterium]|jgi:1-acyl-sn-glycerol-3-phosphate acyltransferase|nr:lysophospholipid acyltransferase family protein [Burkholderiaceae bacterium]